MALEERSGVTVTLPSGQTRRTGSILRKYEGQLSWKEITHIRKGFLAIFCEHHNHHVDNDRQFSSVSCGGVNEHVPCVKRDLRVFRVDDGWHRQDSVLRVINDGVNWGLADNRQVAREVFLGLLYA